jgi:ribonuclease R
MKKYNNIVVSIDNEMASEQRLVEGDRVRVKLDHNDTDDSNYYKVKSLNKISHKDEPGVDVYWEALKRGIDNDFSDESMEQLARIPNRVLPMDRIGRVDLTELETITIDPIGCKDMDDAVSCRRLSNGNFLLRTHHVDVDHWVPMNSPIDKDAYRKGNSSYPANTCIPMLPHELSKGICSLNPGVDRLAITTSMEVDNNGNVVKYSIFPSVIHSDLKMNYEKVNDILKNGTIYPEYEQFKSSLLLMSQLALIFRKKRILEGAIEFDVGDKEEIYDEDGMMIGARMRVNDVAENLIQEFALITNQVCVKHLTKLGIDCIYRIHGTPDEEKLTDYIRFLNINGFRFNVVNARDCIENPRSMQRLVEFSSNCGEFGDVLNSKNIRCMAKAKYYPINKGHYGLGKPIYAKFSNPAREYTCLVNQRLLKSVICPDYHMTKPTLSKLLEISDHCNKKERDSVELERAVYDMNCASFLQDYKGETMMGNVVDISNNGLKARVDNYMEGYIRFKDQTTCFDEDNYSFYVGDQTYNFGDRLELEILENEDVLPLHHTEDERIDYEQYVRRNLDKIDNRNTYFKITSRIHDDCKVLKK